MEDEEKRHHLIDHLLNLSLIYFQCLDNYDSAARHAFQVLNYPHNEKQQGDALTIIGRIFEKRGQFEKALEIYEKLGELSTHSVEGYYRAGRLNKKLQNIRKAT